MRTGYKFLPGDLLMWTSGALDLIVDVKGDGYDLKTVIYIYRESGARAATLQALLSALAGSGVECRLLDRDLRLKGVLHEYRPYERAENNGL